MPTAHIPYEIQENKWFEYEQQWKIRSIELLNLHVPSTGHRKTSVFDFGCGRGEFLQLLKEHGYMAEGGDFDPKCVELSSRFAPTILLSDVEFVKLMGNKKYDVVSAIHVLEHLKDPAGAIEKLSRIANKFLLVAVPNLQSTAYLCIRNRYQANEGHVYGWDYPHFENFLRRICHLDIIQITGDAVPFTTKFSRLDMLVDKLVGRSVIKKFETGWLHRRFPYLSHSILALCKVG